VIVALPRTGPGCLAVSVVSCVAPSVGKGIASTAGGIAASVIGVFVGYLGNAATWLDTQVAGLLIRNTDPNLSATWFTTQLRGMEVVVEVAVVPLLLVATIGAVLHQDLKRLGRIWGVGLPVAVLAAAAGVLFARWLLAFTDTVTSQVVGSSGLKVAPALGHLTLEGAGTGVPLLVTAATDCIAILGAILVWLELVLRQSAIYVAMFFMPLALATYVWPASAVVAKRAVQIVVALILSKFVIVVTIALGLDALSSATPMSQQFAGVGILLLASFTPFALMKLVPIVEVAAIAHLEGMSRRPFHAATRVAATAVSAGTTARSMLAARTRTSPPQGAAQVAPQPLASRAADYPISQGGPSGA
jgi:hypothetical protein